MMQSHSCHADMIASADISPGQTCKHDCLSTAAPLDLPALLPRSIRINRIFVAELAQDAPSLSPPPEERPPRA
ncbi:MAG: hypothetical protein ACK5LJ_04680 [Paracoccus sp. (in: a-proteobacteria)]